MSAALGGHCHSEATERHVTLSSWLFDVAALMLSPFERSPSLCIDLFPVTRSLTRSCISVSCIDSSRRRMIANAMPSNDANS